MILAFIFLINLYSFQVFGDFSTDLINLDKSRDKDFKIAFEYEVTPLNFSYIVDSFDFNNDKFINDTPLVILAQDDLEKLPRDDPKARTMLAMDDDLRKVYEALSIYFKNFDPAELPEIFKEYAKKYNKSDLEKFWNDQPLKMKLYFFDLNKLPLDIKASLFHSTSTKTGFLFEPRDNIAKDLLRKFDIVQDGSMIEIRHKGFANNFSEFGKDLHYVLSLFRKEKSIDRVNSESIHINISKHGLSNPIDLEKVGKYYSLFRVMEDLNRGVDYHFRHRMDGNDRVAYNKSINERGNIRVHSKGADSSSFRIEIRANTKPISDVLKEISKFMTVGPESAFSEMKALSKGFNLERYYLQLVRVRLDLLQDLLSNGFVEMNDELANIIRSQLSKGSFFQSSTLKSLSERANYYLESQKVLASLCK